MDKYTIGIYIRLDSSTKAKLQQKAYKLGVSLSAYIRMLLIQEVNKPDRKK